MNIARLLIENVHKFGEYEQLIYLGPEGKVVRTNIDIEMNARALATGLKKLGITKGDVVGVCVSNIPEIPEIMNGVMRAGAIFLPIIFALAPKEISHLINDSQCKLIITEEKLWEKINESTTGSEGPGAVRDFIVIGTVKKSNIIPYDDLLKEMDQRGDVEEVSEDDLAILMFTAGTTGSPKGVMLSHGNLLSSLKQGAEVWPSDHRDRILITVPMNHIYGVLFYHESCAFGGTTVLLSWFEKMKVLDIITKYNITIAPLVPTMITMMMEVYDPSKYSMKSMRRMISSGAPLSEKVLKKAMTMFDLKIYHGYGCTEAGPTIARQREDRPLKYKSVGPAVPGLEVKLVDEAGNEVPQGKEGEIICKGPGVMKGYWNKTEETKATLKGGWLFTGDLGKMDEEGELYVTGRKKDLIIRGGENIDPGVSENWLYKHPAVLEAAVVGIPDEKYGEEVAAAVALKSGVNVTEEELLKFIQENVHRFFAPKKIFIMDALPKNSAGKILKREIKKKLESEYLKKECQNSH